MHAKNHQDSTDMLSDLERDEAEEWKSSEATLLPVVWLSPQRWQFLLHLRAMENAFCRLPDNEMLSQQVSAEPPLIALAKQYIEDHYPENLSLERVGAALRTDAFHLDQVVRQTTGMDFCDYLACVRVEKAKSLLLNPNYNFSEIASELGFESLGQFNEAFKRIVGEPPRAYRARLPHNAVCILQEF